MYSDELKLYTLSGAKSFEQVTIAKSQLVSTEAPVKKLDTTTLPNGSVLLIPIGFLTLWIIFTSISKFVSKFSNLTLRLPDTLEVIGEEVLIIEHFHNFPCRNCRYFESNPYLKCTVQPSFALTVRSLDCSDYYPKNEHC